jgi:predicted DNA-binding transcriptional regulator AlpA
MGDAPDNGSFSTMSDTTLDERAYNIPEACERLGGLSRRQFYDELKAGRLKARKIGRRTVVLHSAIVAYLDSLPTFEDDL